MKLAAVTAIVLAVLPTVLSAGDHAPKPVEIDWLKANAVPFATAEAGNGFEDLAALGAVIGDARIVALGRGDPAKLIGGMAINEQFFPAVVADQYDVMIYFDTTAARQLKTAPGR